MDVDSLKARLQEAMSHTEEAHAICFELRKAGEIRFGEDPDGALKEAIRLLRKLMSGL